MRVVLGVVLSAVVLVPATAAPKSPSAPAPTGAVRHLEAVLKRSAAPEYRRAGSAGMAKVAKYEAATLAAAGYQVVRQDVDLGAARYAIDYTKGHQPLLRRADDGRRFKVDSAFYLTKTTGVEGLTCEVKAIADVGPGDCGFIPFTTASPEWKNAPNYDPSGAADEILGKGGVGAVIQGDAARNAVIALSVRRPLPSVVAVVEPDDVIGHVVRLRAMGSLVPTVAHNVIGVRRAPAGTNRVVLMLAHADGWYQAAADNGGGVAAVLRAAELLAATPPDVGVAVALVDAEEIGLLGSQRLAEALASPDGVALPDGGPPLRMSDLAAVVNLDASSARASDAQAPIHAATGTDAPVFSWRVMVYSEHAVLPGLFLGTFAEHGVLGLPVSSQGAQLINGGWRTDAKWFHEAGVPVAWPAAGYPEYHTDADTLRAVDPADLEAIAEAAAELVPRLGAMPAAPVIK
jgi:hypothetical protein